MDALREALSAVAKQTFQCPLTPRGMIPFFFFFSRSPSLASIWKRAGEPKTW